ncbi:MAG: hypothetical protein A2Y80_02460 [Deltaproteobacteria bacterium RBG_13_58_19]|nr:MAG: hypothetical protein A2Y80_02460 [Deltaproteobacteria bacterium RBG_13_58_19]
MGKASRIVLINPPVNLEKSYGRLKHFYAPIPPIGVAYLAAALRRAGHQVFAIDAYLTQLSVAEVVDAALAFEPDLVGLSVLTPAEPPSRAISQAIKRLRPECWVVWGNVHATCFYEEAIAQGYADVVNFGEGEERLVQIAAAYPDKEALAAIKSIAYGSQGQVVVTAKGETIDNLDDLPYPAWDLFPVEKFMPDARLTRKAKIGHGEVQALPILASRGCPNRCTFCCMSTDKALGRKYRMRDPIKVVDEIQHWVETYDCRTFFLMDLCFPLNKKHALTICQEIIDRRLDISWMAETRVDYADPEVFQALKKAGCSRLNFGLESGVQRLLDRLKKGFTLEQARRAVVLAHEAGLEAEGLFIIGLPGETVEDTWETVRFAKELKLNLAKFNLLVPYPGTALYEEFEASGQIRHHDWEAYSPTPGYGGADPAYVPEGREAEELHRLQCRAFRSFFFSPRVIWSNLKEFRPRMLKDYWEAFKAIVIP